MAKRADERTVWWVEHPGYGIAVVQAPDWELATTEAAKWWDVPWKSVAALCECQRKETVPRFVCAECGSIFYGREADRLLCALCAAKERDRELSRRAAHKRYWREMGPRRAEK